MPAFPPREGEASRNASSSNMFHRSYPQACNTFVPLPRNLGPTYLSLNMAAMMPTGGGGGRSANPYEQYDAPTVEDDLIDPDDGWQLYWSQSSYND